VNAPDIDAYAVLGLPRGATLEEITARYRTLAQSAHPDRPGGDGARMTLLNQAYDLLRERVTEAQDPTLEKIKALVSGKSVQEIRRVRDDIRTHIRSFEQRGFDGRYAGALNDPRLARHRRELAYLDGLLA
jgi:curved DNA-binding protein CbpA